VYLFLCSLCTTTSLSRLAQNLAYGIHIASGWSWVGYHPYAIADQCQSCTLTSGLRTSTDGNLELAGRKSNGERIEKTNCIGNNYCTQLHVFQKLEIVVSFIKSLGDICWFKPPTTLILGMSKLKTMNTHYVVVSYTTDKDFLCRGF